jgi:polar amino acid transport system substrate-binding protein
MKMINRVLVVIVVAAAILAACRPSSGSNSLPKLVVGVDANFPPFGTIRADKNEFTGFDIELIKAIASKAGYQVEFVNEARNILLSGMIVCRYDAAISAFAITSQLEGQIQFSDPYLTVDLVVIVQKGNITISGPAGLAGAMVGVENISPAASEVAKISDAQLVNFTSSDQAFQNLINGNVEAVVAGRTLALKYANIPANHLKIVGDKLGFESYAISVCKAKPDLLAKINTALAAVKNDGTLNGLIKKWIKK